MTSFKDKFKELAVKVFVPNEGEECEMIYLEDALDVANLMDVSKEGVNAEWESFRREAAKDVLPAVIAKKSSMCSFGEVVKEAVQFADALIKQLKKGREMKLTKEDYMRLPKERLAELLVEIESQKIELQKIELPISPSSVWGCDGVHCTNPQMDCINCPRKNTGGALTSPNTATGTSALKADNK